MPSRSCGHIIRGRAGGKAADRRIYVLGKDVIQVKDAVERGPGRVPGIKAVLDVVPVDLGELGRLSKQSNSFMG